MNNNIELTTLMTSINTLKKVQAARSAIPIMSHVAVSYDAHGRAVLTASDLENYLSITVAGSICNSEFTVERSDLEKVLTGGDKGKLVQLSVDHGQDRDGAVAVTHDDISAELSILPYDDFPIAQDSQGGTVTVVTSYETLRGALTYCKGAMSKEETRYYLRGVNLHQTGGDSGKLGAVATDGHRLNLAETGICYDGRSVFLRDSAVPLILEVMGKSEGTVTLRLPQSETPNQWVTVSGDGWVLTSQEVNGSFPDYTRVIPDMGNGKATLSCADVASAATRISRITSKRGACIIDAESGVIGHAGGDGIKAVSVKVGNMHPSGSVVPVGVNPLYLSSVMADLGAFADTCTVYLSDSGNPIRMHPRSLPAWAENLTSVVMPMRY
jgi:DNA polymerase-3 subunit beta